MEKESIPETFNGMTFNDNSYHQFMKRQYKKSSGKKIRDNGDEFSKWRKEQNKTTEEWKTEKWNAWKRGNELRSRKMNKQYLKAHPHEFLRKQNVTQKVREWPDPREWTDREGNKYFGYTRV